MNTIDLRSDTVTWPTPAMREAMAKADVGDDVYGEDPTVNELEAEAARMLGKEAAVFVTSGTMGNLSSILAHCGRGEEMILGKQSHIFRSEAGSAVMFGGVQPHTLEVNPNGTLDLDAIRSAIREDNEHFPATSLICLENTQAGVGGVPVTAEYTAQVGEIARAHGLKLHIDGARIFNAAAALNTPVVQLVDPADSVTFCLSKGLCAPAGSIVVGPADFIRRVRRARKALGGGMRQTGVLAAAGLIALREMTQRLADDHANACALAEGLATVPHIRVDPSRVYTNMVFINIDDNAPIQPDEMVSRLKNEYNVVIGGYSNGRTSIRLVTHYWITRESIDHTVEAMRALLS